MRWPSRRAPALVAIALLTVALARKRPFRVAVAGDSMASTLLPGDWLVAMRGRPRRGDLVVLDHPLREGFELVKRVEGVPGDVVDGRMLRPGELWVVGDRPAASTDSRSFGPVEARAVRGVVRLRYWPAGRVHLFR